jgi:L-lactate dehydrogenase complex protein LldE
MTNIAIFATCFNDTLYPKTVAATVLLLKRLGYVAEVPATQGCCGQMHVNTGYPDLALPMVENFVSTFERYDYVVSPSASCVGSIRHQHAMVAQQGGRSDLQGAVMVLAPRVLDISEFLIDVVGVEDVGATFPHKVTYHTTCHSLRALQVGDRPLRLLKAVKGIEYIPLEDSDSCCGFGGTFSVKNSDVSTAMMGDKLDAVARTGAAWLVSGDNSCLMHLGGGLSRRGSQIRRTHLVEILAGTVQ